MPIFVVTFLAFGNLTNRTRLSFGGAAAVSYG